MRDNKIEQEIWSMHTEPDLVLDEDAVPTTPEESARKFRRAFERMGGSDAVIARQSRQVVRIK